MSVLVVTSLGDLVVDLHTDKCPLTTKNFLKLCKIKYFNGCLFHTVQKDFTAQTGDPTGKGTGGDSIYKFLYGEQARFFPDEIFQDLKHSKTGTVAMATAGENLNASQFYFTLRDDLDYLDGKHTVFGEVAEGLDTLTRINEAYVDEKGKPFKNIRIKHTYILDDPFEDPPQLAELIPDASPEGKPKDEVDDDVRLEDDWVPMDEQLAPSELEEVLLSKEAHSRAVVLESIGDIPDAEIKPPDNVLFVCKLNPVTQDEDLNTIFSRFGNVVLAEIIRDFKTGDSLCYAFIEYEDREACEQAYFKMDNALIDDRRIHVDFSQSVSKLWSQYRRKGNQMDNGKGCFKCGATDHIARDCIGGPSNKMQPPKYILKDDNTQRGGNDKSSYEMVFDDDSPMHSKRRHENETENRKEMRKLDKRDSKQDMNRCDERSRGYRENERKKGSAQRGSQRDEGLHEDRAARDKDHNKKHGSYRGLRDEGDNKKGKYHEDRRDGGGYQNTGDHRDRRSCEKDYRKRSGEGQLRNEVDYRKSEHRGERRDREGYQKTDDHGDRREREHRNRSEDRDKRGSHRQDRESRKRSADSDHDCRSGIKSRDRR